MVTSCIGEPWERRMVSGARSGMETSRQAVADTKFPITLRRMRRYSISGFLPAVILVFGGVASADPAFEELADLGRALFFDVRLSAGRNQSCASCHDPARAFSESRDNGVGRAASLGDDGESLGDRNAPTLTYAMLIPPFGKNPDGEFHGGLFVDGRAANLAEQSREPILNPAEMALPAPALGERLAENPAYLEAFARLLGASAIVSPQQSLRSVATAIAAYENSGEFARFDSRYDRYLRGEAELTREEEIGRVLFFSELINCNRCHLVDRREHRPNEVFTNYRYHNIGVPANPVLRERNGLGGNYADPGLAGNPAVNDTAQSGRFRVPSLRNVAVTGPYMHNGVFAKLETAILFYNRFLLGDPANLVNPETGRPWSPAEVPGTVDVELLRGGQPLTAERVAYLVAFLETLTDARYEHLLER
jgi:cytochrome c peroxidase